MSDAFDLADAVVHNSPTPAWPVTAALTRLEVRADGVSVTFSKQDGPGRWPDVIPPGWTGSIQYTLWLGMQILGVWHVAGLIEYWYGLGASGGNIILDDQIARNWTYDCGPMARQPVPGEIVAFFVTAGDQRKKDVFLVHERSQVVTVPFPRAVPAVFTFEAPGPVPEPPGHVPGPVPPVDLGPFLAHLDALEDRLKVRIDALEQRMKTHEDTPPPVCPPLPDYTGTGKLFGFYSFTVRSKPVV